MKTTKSVGNPRMCSLSKTELLLQASDKSKENKCPPELGSIFGQPSYANSSSFKTDENVNSFGKKQADVYLQ